MLPRRSWLVASSFVLSLLAPLAARGLTPDDRAQLERRLAAQRVLAEQQGRPSPPELVWADALEGRDALPAGEAAAWLAQLAPTVSSGTTADERATAPRLPAGAEQRARWARAAGALAVAGRRAGAGGRVTSATATGTASVSGRVVRALDGSGVAEMDVYLTNFDGVDDRVTKADATGAFSFSGVVAGHYWLSASGSDFLAGTLYGEGPCPGSSCSFRSNNTLEVVDGASLSGYDLELLAAGVIAGSVVRAGASLAATAEPVEGMFVQAVAFQPDGSIWQNYTYTDAAGSFRLPGTPAGAWILATDGDQASVGEVWPDTPCPGGYCVYDIRTLAGVEVVADQVNDGFDFVLEPGHGITGTVTRTADGSPLADIAVDVYSPEFGRFLCTGTTAADGTYRTCALPAGDYVAQAYTYDRYVYQLYHGRDCASFASCFGDADLIAVAADVDASGIDFALTDAGSIAGQVTHAVGGAAAVGKVLLYAGDGIVDQQNVDGEGRFYFRALAPGSYLAEAVDDADELVGEVYNNHPCVAGCDLTAGDAIAVASNERATADFALDEKARLGGTVRGVTSGVVAGSAPLADVIVTVWSSETRSAAASTTTAADGSWAVSYPAGRYLVTFGKTGYRSEMFDGLPCAASCELSQATVIEVGPGEERLGLDATLELGGVLAGRVTVKASGAAVRSARVDVYREVAVNAFGYVSSTVTDGHGRWRLSGLIPGTYKVRLIPGPKFRPMLYEATSCDFLACQVAVDGLAIVLGELEQRTDIDMAVARSVVLEGQVRSDATGRPIKGGSVALRDIDRNAVVYAGVSQRGGFRVGSLPPGRFRLTAAADNELLLGKAWPNAVCPQHSCVDSGDLLELAEAGAHSGYDLSLGPAAVLTGRLVDAATGEGLDRALVIGLDQSQWNFPGFTDSRSDGTFRMGGLAPAPLLVGTLTTSTQYGGNQGQEASYYVDELAGDKACAELGCDPRPSTLLELAVGGQEVTLALSRGATVSGTLTGVSAGAAATSVDLLDVSGRPRPASTAFAGTDGSWRIQGVPPGRYYLYVSHSGKGLLYPDLECRLGSCDLTQGEQIEVGTDDVSGLAVNVIPRPTGSLWVRVAAGAHGRLQGGAVLDYYDAEGTRIGSLPRSRRTGDLAGELVVGGIAPGDYYVRATVPGYVPAVYPDVPCPGNCDVTRGQLIHVAAAPEPATAMTIELTTPSVVLRGRVADAHGVPVPGLGVGGYSSSGTFFSDRVVEWDGNYRLDYLPAGRLLQALSWAGGDWIPEAREDVYCSRDACDWSAAAAVDTAPGDEVAGLDFVVDRGGSLGGQVLEAETGLPLGGVEVQVRTLAGTLVSGPASNADGYWRSAGLPPGHYFVRTVGTVGYVDATLGGAACDPDCPADQGNDVLITEPGRVDGVDLVLARE